MVTRAIWASVVLGALFAATLPAGIKEVLAEPNLEKRARLALDNAESSYQSARTAYEAGNTTTVAASLHELQESIEVAYASLESTGKDPRKSPKWFKKAEMQTRDLVRRLSSFRDSMSFDDRAVVDPVQAKVQQVHDELLMGLMEGKRK